MQSTFKDVEGTNASPFDEIGVIILGGKRISQ